MFGFFKKEQKEQKKKAEKAEELLENKHYYIENGNYVFTALYLKNRGYCCGNGCRHCPYEK